MASDTKDLTGRTLGTCTLEKLIGQGGMGAVYLARQARPVRNVAVKVLLPNHGVSSGEEFLARFRREADLIAQLEHVNIMPIYEYGEQDGIAYLVMPYLSGGSLKDRLLKRGALPLQEVISYIEQAASALDYAHARGVLHRDLKPANFLLHADGRLVLADFGIARMLDENTSAEALTSTGMVIGTPEYMAPEMVNDEPLDYRVDIYELGMVLFHLLSGHVAFNASTPYALLVKHVQETVPLLHRHHATVPAAVDAVIQKATAKQREDRYTSAREMARALRAAATTPDTYYQDDHNAPTVYVLPVKQTVLASPAVQRYSQPLYEQQDLAWQAASQARYEGGYTSSPYNTPYPPPSKKRGAGLPWLGAFLAVLIIIAGTLIGVQVSRGALRMPAIAGPGSTATVAPGAPTTTPGTTPTHPSTIGIHITPTVPAGMQIYGTTRPGPHCDNQGGTWQISNNLQIVCPGRAVLRHTFQHGLQGTTLVNIPGQDYPTDYVVQARLQPLGKKGANFGIFFRNQPGSQSGAYSFLVNTNESWSINIYNNQTGDAERLQGGELDKIKGPVTLAVVVKGQQFSAYINGNLLGTASDGTYGSGTAGIAVGPGLAVQASHFGLYATQ